MVWRRSPMHESQSERTMPITIVVAMHNEALAVPTLLPSLLAATTDCDQIIIVLDHCTDNTEAILRSFASNRVQIIDNIYAQGKKNAQRLGVSLAQTDLVVTTDADCVVTPSWLRAIDKYQCANQCDMIIMPVRMASDGSLMGDVMELEFDAIQMATAGCALMDNASMCNGANMAFRREVYLGHNQNNNYVSGDDMFLLASVKQNGGKIGYIKSPDALVATTVPHGFRQYMKQRTRWFRKSSGYTDEQVQRVALAMFLGNISWPLILIYGNFSLALSIFLAKTIAEAILINAGRKVLYAQLKPLPLLILAITYPITIILIVIFSVFRSKRAW